jgi:cytochrome c-type biogenesis protein CcmF
LWTSVFARESLICASVFLLLLLTIVVMIGTLVAPLTKMFMGRMIQVGPEFYNNVLPPIALAILAMTAAVPALQWGAPPRTHERRLLMPSLAISGIVTLAALAAGARHPLTLAMIALAALTCATLIAAWFHDAWRHEKRIRWRGLASALRGGRRKYAAFSVHLGIACIAVGVAGSSLGTQRHELEISEGDTIHWAGRQIRYVRLEQTRLPDKLVAEAVLEITSDGKPPVTLRPARHLHLLQNEWTSEVAIHSTWSGDFYTILHAGLGNGRISLSLVDNPMIGWIWLGGIWTAASALVAALPTRLRRQALANPFAKQLAIETAPPPAAAA